MKIREWEIWHTYTTYLKGSLPNLYNIARNIIISNLAEFVIHRDGFCIGKTDNGYQIGITDIKVNTTGKQANFILKSADDSEIKFIDFALENWLISSQFRYSEIRLFDNDNSLPPPYIRFFLGTCILNKNDFGEINVYPMITLFESGVVVNHFRIIGNEQKISVDDFINQYVNLFTKKFDSIDVPSIICSLAPIAEHYYKENISTPLKRYNLVKKQKLHDVELYKIKKDVQIGDFTFNLATLTKNNEEETITGLAHTLFNVVNYVINKHNSNIKFIVFGQKPKVEIGDYWYARPNVHIIRHDNQANTATKNEKRNKDSFGWIIARTYGCDEEHGSKYLPKNLRTFEDYLSYVSSAVTLFIWSKVGLRRQKKWADANRGHLIYEQQAKVEMLEYGYMLHKSIFNSLNDINGFNTVIKLRRYITDLNNKMSRIGHFGEIWEFFIKAWSEMGLDNLRSQISERLDIQESENKYKESKRSEIYSRVLTIIFGLIAVPSFAYEVIKPVWLLLGFWYPCQNNTNIFNLYFIGISLIIILLIILTLKIITKASL